MNSFRYPFFKNSVVINYTGKGVVGISYSMKSIPKPKLKNNIERKLAQLLEKYMSGTSTKLNVDIDWEKLQGTDFQKKVWRKLYSIPYGQVKTYSEIAKAISFPKASRAVGTACGKNPVLLAIPCHRVVGVSGLGGFSGGGLPVKRKLHKLEGIAL